MAAITNNSALPVELREVRFKELWNIANEVHGTEACKTWAANWMASQREGKDWRLDLIEFIGGLGEGLSGSSSRVAAATAGGRPRRTKSKRPTKKPKQTIKKPRVVRRSKKKSKKKSKKRSR